MSNEEIKQWCKHNKLSQGELAARLGYAENTLRRALNGFSTMQPRMLEAIKRVMDEEATNKAFQALPIAPITEEELQQAASAIGKSPQELRASILQLEALNVANEASTSPAN